MKISIIFPCYNEQDNLATLSKALTTFPVAYNVEFILVENGSTDNSRTLFKDIDHPRIRKVYIDKNQGYGYGIKAGIRIAKGDYIGWMHADLQYNPLKLTNYIDYLHQTAKTPILLKGKRLNRSRIDQFFTTNMSILNSIIFKTKMFEIMSSPTIAPRELLANLDGFPSDFSIDIYTYALAKHEKYPVVHLPIKLSPREKGNSSWNAGLKSRLKMSKTLIQASFKIKHQIRNLSNSSSSSGVPKQ